MDKIQIKGRIKSKKQKICPNCKQSLIIFKTLKLKNEKAQSVNIYCCQKCSINYCRPSDYELLKKYDIKNGCIGITIEVRANSPVSQEIKINCEFLDGRYCKIIAGTCDRYNLRCVKFIRKNAIYRVPPHYNQVYLADNSTNTNSRKNIYKNRSMGTRYYGYNSNVTTLHSNESPSKIYVFGGRLNLPKQQVRDYYITVSDIMDQLKKYYILAAYYEKLNKYYVSYTQIQQYIKMGCHLKLKLYIDNTAGTETLEDFSGFNPYSLLSLYGYKVGINGLSTFQRQTILTYIIEHDILSKWEIIEKLQSNISLRENRTDKDFGKAIENWKNDIMFVNSYGINKHLTTSYQLKESEKCLKCGRPRMSGSQYCFQCRKDMNDAEV